jgi:myo-inositol-1(or 4)-monophosphatase
MSTLTFSEVKEIVLDLGLLMQGLIRREILDLQGSADMMMVEEKGGEAWNVVTQADLKSEELLVAYVKRKYPTWGLRAEEGTLIPSGSGFQLIFDPVDGTARFANGGDEFGVSLGLKDHNDHLVAGIIDYPRLCIPESHSGVTVVAIVDHGLVLLRDGEPIAFNPRWVRRSPTLLKEAIIVPAVEVGKEYLIGQLRDGMVRGMSYSNSFVVDVLNLIRGKVNVIFHTGATPYDVAAAIPIAREAGCVISGLSDLWVDTSREKIPIIMAQNMELLVALQKFLKVALCGVD